MVYQNYEIPKHNYNISKWVNLLLFYNNLLDINDVTSCSTIQACKCNKFNESYKYFMFMNSLSIMFDNVVVWINQRSSQ